MIKTLSSYVNCICESTMTFSLQLCTKHKVAGCILKITIKLFSPTKNKQQKHHDSELLSNKLSTSNLRQTNKYIYKTFSGISRLTWALAAWPLHNKIYFRFHYLIGYDITPEISNGLDEECGCVLRLTRPPMIIVWPWMCGFLSLAQSFSPIPW